MFIVALFVIAKTQKQPRCPLVGEWIKTLVLSGPHSTFAPQYSQGIGSRTNHGYQNPQMLELNSQPTIFAFLPTGFHTVHFANKGPSNQSYIYIYII